VLKYNTSFFVFIQAPSVSIGDWELGVGFWGIDWRGNGCLTIKHSPFVQDCEREPGDEGRSYLENGDLCELAIVSLPTLRSTHKL